MKIEIIHNGQIIETKELGEGSYKIGRSSECDIQLKSQQISKQHALLVIKGTKAAIIDLGSANGVFVNGARISSAKALSPGDEVQIGNTRFRFEV